MQRIRINIIVICLFFMQLGGCSPQLLTQQKSMGSETFSKNSGIPSSSGDVLKEIFQIDPNDRAQLGTQITDWPYMDPAQFKVISSEPPRKEWVAFVNNILHSKNSDVWDLIRQIAIDNDVHVFLGGSSATKIVWQTESLKKPPD